MSDPGVKNRGVASSAGGGAIGLRSTDDRLGDTIEQTLAEFGSDAASGLSSSEASARLERYGPNAITETEEPLWRQLARRFWGPIPWMIEIAAVLSAVVGRWEDFAIITVMLLANAGIDFGQAYRANSALAALKAGLASDSLVLRDGTWTTVDSELLVPGDVIRLRLGDIVPADAQLLDDGYLLVDQSALTGESLPVTRQSGDLVYSGTVVGLGEMTALVVNTGANTNFHSVVSLVAGAESEERSHFQQMVIRIGDFLIALTAVLVLVIVLVGLFRGQDFLELARFSMVLTVASIPVALPAVLSVTMAVGAAELAKRKAIVSRLVAIEELAGVDVLCSDKTGTLTKNEMAVADPVAFDGHTLDELFALAALASRREANDPIEVPIFRHITQELPHLDLAEYEVTDFSPFDPTRKRTEATVRHGDETFTAIKGAPQVILALAEQPTELAAHIGGLVDQLAAKGFRTLAVARGDDAVVDLVGLIPLVDPPRDESASIIADMRGYGITVKMITGDNLAIAREIGSTLGLQGRAVLPRNLSASGSEELTELARIIATAVFERLEDDDRDQAAADRFGEEVAREVAHAFETADRTPEFIRSHESEIVAVVDEAEIFAEVIPEDKYLIVDTLQRSSHIVAMTGDGVNDAPALKRADAGIAVSNATDAARAAADIVLTEPGLGVIAEAIKLSRTIFERMKSYAIFRVAETIRVILFMFLAIVVFDFFPITALMIVILALLNDIPILAIAYDNTKVDPNPVRWNMPTMLTTATALGVAGLLSSFTLFYILVELDYPTEMIQSMFFAKLVIAGHGTIYNTRTEGWFWQKPYPSSTLFLTTFSTRVIGTLIAVYGVLITAIGWERGLLMWAYALAWFVLNDGVKVLTYRVLRERGRYA